MTATIKRPTNVSLPQNLVLEAKSLDISLSKACERGLTEAIAEARSARWLAENKGAVEAWNQRVEAVGLPLARFRQF
ncbi:type II toxin-antitoxin system CcdA family antitoxin [Paramagnetospirillum kuznetsovii]|nr:type II toxin-antitoxin system CcdA family antitoxin [Paramagnetospirillum kuznetsovii]